MSASREAQVLSPGWVSSSRAAQGAQATRLLLLNLLGSWEQLFTSGTREAVLLQMDRVGSGLLQSGRPPPPGEERRGGSVTAWCYPRQPGCKTVQVNQEELEAAQVFVWVGVTVKHPVRERLACFPVLHVDRFITSARFLQSNA